MVIDETWDIYHQIKMQDSIYPYILFSAQCSQKKHVRSGAQDALDWKFSRISGMHNWGEDSAQTATCQNEFATRCTHFRVQGMHIYSFQCTYSAKCTHCPVHTLHSAHTAHTLHIVDIQCSLNRVQCIVYCEWAFWPPPDIGLGIDVQGQGSISASESEKYMKS